MKPLLAGVAALVLALSLGLGAPAPSAQAGPSGGVVQQYLLPAAPQKTTKAKPRKTPSATPTPTPAAATPTARPRSAAEEEGDRWVQIAVVAGSGLLGCVLVFFGIGALLRRRPRSRT